LVCLACVAVVACASAGPTGRLALYVADAPDGRRLLVLDPSTLTDRAGAAPTELGSPAWGWSFSADGATAVEVVYPEGPSRGLYAEPTVVVRDARTGAERARFAAPARDVGATPSRDG